MAKHRAWRIYIEAVQNQGRHCQVAAHIEMRTDYDTPDLCRSIGGAPFARSGDPGGAFDGDAFGTYWHSSCGNLEEWIGWDFGANPQDIGCVVYVARRDGYGNQDSLIRGRVQWSDDMVNWTDDWIIPQQHGWLDSEVRTFIRQGNWQDENGHRYWRLFSTEHYGDAAWSGLSNTRLYRGDRIVSACGTPIQEGATYWLPFQLFMVHGDWNTGIYQARYQQEPQWFGYDFGPGQKPVITKFLTAPNRDNAPARSWGGFALEWSDDGVNWTRQREYGFPNGVRFPNDRLQQGYTEFSTGLKLSDTSRRRQLLVL